MAPFLAERFPCSTRLVLTLRIVLTALFCTPVCPSVSLLLLTPEADQIGEKEGEENMPANTSCELVEHLYFRICREYIINTMDKLVNL